MANLGGGNARTPNNLVSVRTPAVVERGLALLRGHLALVIVSLLLAACTIDDAPTPDVQCKRTKLGPLLLHVVELLDDGFVEEDVHKLVERVSRLKEGPRPPPPDVRPPTRDPAATPPAHRARLPAPSEVGLLALQGAAPAPGPGRGAPERVAPLAAHGRYLARRRGDGRGHDRPDPRAPAGVADHAAVLAHGRWAAAVRGSGSCEDGRTCVTGEYTQAISASPTALRHRTASTHEDEHRTLG